MKDIQDSVIIKPLVHLSIASTGTCILRSSQIFQKFKTISPARTKQMDVELAILKLDAHKPLSFSSQKTCDLFDQIRCDISTAINMKKQIEIVHKERDELRGKMSQLKVCWFLFYFFNPAP